MVKTFAKSVAVCIYYYYLPLAAEVEEVVAEGVSVPLQVLELPEPQLGEEGVAPLLSLDARKGHLQMQLFYDYIRQDRCL